MQHARGHIDDDDFFRALQGSNPFTKNRVSEVGDIEVDVPAIHGDAFTKLTRRIDRARQDKISAGVMLLGAAGLGKSHLLARLCQWARAEGRATAVFLHNVVASPERMPRYLLRATVSALAGHRPEAYCESDLYALINRAVAQLQTDGRRLPSTAARIETLQRIGRLAPEDATIVQVLTEFLSAAIEATSDADRRAVAAVEWLSGEIIDADHAASLGLPAVDEGGASLADDIGIEGVFRVLARLGAVAGHVLLLCIDQVDNLHHDQVSALSSFLHVLLDHTQNLVVVTSGVKQSMTSFRDDQTISQAAWDRLAQHVVELNRIDADEARRLVEARIGRFVQPFQGLPSVARLQDRDPLFPLDQGWLSSRLGDLIEVRPRDVISWAHSRWEEQQDRLEDQGGPQWLDSWPGGDARPAPPVESLEEAIDKLAHRKLIERIQQRQLQPESLPPDADNLATLVLTLLGHCRGDPRYTLVEVRRSERKARTAIYDLIAHEQRPDGTKVSTGVLFVTSTHKTQVAYALRQMAEDPKPPDHRILVTDEDRRPLALGPKGVEYYRKLEALDRHAFVHIKLTFDEYAHLDACAGVLGSARVGDLEVEHPHGKIRSVSEAEAVESLHRQRTLVAHRLLRELLTEEGAGRAPTVIPLLAAR